MRSGRNYAAENQMTSGHLPARAQLCRTRWFECSAMKTKTFLVVCSIAAALQFAPAGLAQGPDDQDFGKRGRHARMANLSVEERAQFRAAHRQAMADPAVRAAKDRQIQAAKEFRELKRARMLQADPSLQPVLDKMPARGRRGR
jgi:hypothetical protein